MNNRYIFGLAVVLTVLVTLFKTFFFVGAAVTMFTAGFAVFVLRVTLHFELELFGFRSAGTLTDGLKHGASDDMVILLLSVRHQRCHETRFSINAYALRDLKLLYMHPGLTREANDWAEKGLP